VALSVDEFEALRLADLEGLYQDEAAIRMGVSRPTFARIVEASRRKVAEALVHGRALRIGGGPVALAGRRRFRCDACRHEWSLPFGTGRPAGCPDCGALALRRTDARPRLRRGR
jgi:transposase-like protein